jgi:hypothetical protein
MGLDHHAVQGDFAPECVPSVEGWGGSPELKNDVSAARCPAHARATKTLHHFEIAPLRLLRMRARRPRRSCHHGRNAHAEFLGRRIGECRHVLTPFAFATASFLSELECTFRSRHLRRVSEQASCASRS